MCHFVYHQLYPRREFAEGFFIQPLVKKPATIYFYVFSATSMVISFMVFLRLQLVHKMNTKIGAQPVLKKSTFLCLKGLSDTKNRQTKLVQPTITT